MATDVLTHGTPTSLDWRERYGDDRRRSGRHLIAAAWGVEVLAAAIGLAMAALIMYQAATETDEVRRGLGTASGIMEMFLGGLPFIVVAVVELTKIPLATAFYHADGRLWRATFLIAMVVLMAVTFETIATGMERSFATRTYVIQQTRKDLQTTADTIRQNEARIAELSAVTLDALTHDHKQLLAQIAAAQDAESDELAALRNDVVARYSSQEVPVLERELAAIDDQLKGEEQRFAELRQATETSFRQTAGLAEGSAKSQRESLQAQLEQQQRQLAELNTREQAELAQVRGDGDVNAHLEKDRQEINRRYDAELEQARLSHEERRQGIEKQREELAAAIAKVESDLAAELRRLDQTIGGLLGNAKDEARATAARRIEALRQRDSEVAGQLASLSLEPALQAINRRRAAEIEKATEQRLTGGSAADRQRREIRQRYAAERATLQRAVQELSTRLGTISVTRSVADLTERRNAEMARLEREHRARLDELNRRRAEVQLRLGELRTTHEEQRRGELARLDERQRAVIEKHDGQRAREHERFAAEQTRLEAMQARADALRAENESLRQRQVRHGEEIRRRAQDNQIYRLAALVYGRDSAVDITAEELRNVSAVWFGGLAAITAWTGTLLALAGLNLKYSDARRERSAPPHRDARLHATLRRTLLAIRRRTRRTVVRTVEREVPREIVREVPVERIVFRDVPREVVRKEIVYLPFVGEEPGRVPKPNGQALTVAEAGAVS